MPLVIDIQAQAAFKAFVTQTSHTSPLRNWFQEPFEAKPILYGRDIRAVQPSFAATQAEADAYAAANPTIVQKVTLQQMTFVPGTNNNALGLYAIPGDATSNVLGNWISPFDGSGFGYFPRFFRDAAGTDEITTSFGPTNWFFHAFAGLLVWGGETASDNWVTAGVTTVYATLYRYVGPTLESIVVGGGTPATVGFTIDKAVPRNGTRFMNLGRVATSAAPWVAPSAMRLEAVSVSVDVADPTRDYTVDVLINGAVAFAATLSAGSSKITLAVGAAMVAGDEVQVRVVRSSGSGKSSFRNAIVNLQLAAP